MGGWDRGTQRPGGWGIVRRFAEQYGIDPGDAAKLPLGTAPGDPNPNGPGTLILPIDDRAKQLDVAVPCEREGCKKVTECRGRKLAGMKSGHAKWPTICESCEYESRLVRAIVLVQCPGFKAYGQKYRSRRCENGENGFTREMTRRQLRGTARARGRRSSANEASRECQCDACSRAEKLHRWRHREVMKFIKPLWKEAQNKRKMALAHSLNDADAAWGEFWKKFGFDPNRFDPRKRIQIQSLPDLSDLYKRCFKLAEFKDLKGDVVKFAPAFKRNGDRRLPWAGGGRRGRPNKPEGKKTSPFVGQLIRRARESGVSYVQGYCRFCSEVLFSWKKVTAHKPCFNEHRGSSGEPVISLQELDLLRRNYAWALRNVFGTEPQEKIAKEAGITEEGVRKAIESVISDLPSDERKLPALFRIEVSILRGDTTLRDPRKFRSARGFVNPNLKRRSFVNQVQ